VTYPVVGAPGIRIGGVYRGGDGKLSPRLIYMISYRTRFLVLPFVFLSIRPPQPVSKVSRSLHPLPSKQCCRDGQNGAEPQFHFPKSEAFTPSKTNFQRIIYFHGRLSRGTWIGNFQAGLHTKQSGYVVALLVPALCHD
jgi:hypothetical protein